MQNETNNIKIKNFKDIIFDKLPQLILYANTNLEVEYTNSNFNYFFNLEEDKIKGKSIKEIFSGQHLKKYSSVIENITNRKPGVFTHCFNIETIGQVYLKITVKPDLNNSNELLGYVFVYENITDIIYQKDKENDLNNHYKNYIESLLPGYFFYSFDIKSRITFVSKNFEQISGVKVNDAIGKEWFELVSWEETSKTEGLQTVQKIIKTGSRSKNITMKFFKTNGQPVYLQLYGTPKYNNSNDLVGVDGFGQDVTDAVNMHNELLKQNRKLLLALETGRFGMWEYDLIKQKANTESLNRYKITGFDPNEKSIPLFEKWLQFTSKKTQDELLKIKTAYSKGVLENSENEIEYHHPQKGWITLYVGSRLIRNSENKPSKIIGTTKDITNLKKREIKLKELSRKLLQSYYEIKKQRLQLEETNKKLKLAQNQLVQSEKMSSIGTLAAGIAHEINNPINFINAGLESLKKHYQKTIELIEFEVQNKNEKFKSDLKKQITSSHEMFDVIRQGVIQTQKIVQSLRYYTVGKQYSKEFFQLKEIIDLALLMIKGEKDPKIKIIKKIDDIPLIYGYPTEITQLFSNLFLNATQSIKENGEITVESNYHILEKRIEIEVKDNGSGIPEKVKDKIFEPFFTTKDVDEGSGLGLYICYNIIKKHNGSIAVFSDEGKGTRFIISIPLNY